jgi:hypothetical protein
MVATIDPHLAVRRASLGDQCTVDRFVFATPDGTAWRPTLGRLDQADEHLRAAQQLDGAIGDHVLFARAVIGRTGTVLYGHSDPEGSPRSNDQLRCSALTSMFFALRPRRC